jgi:hypothetical protein
MKPYAKKTACCNNVSNSRDKNKKMKSLESIKFISTRSSKTLKVTITILYKIAQIQKSTSKSIKTQMHSKNLN